MNTAKFVICSPCYNAARFVEGSILSALHQVYDQFRICWLDDGSADGSADVARKMFALEENRARATMYSNDRRRGAVRNYWWLAQQCEPGEVMVFLDADDQLSHPGVLRRLAGVYLDADVWATYGQFRYDAVSGGGIGMAAPLPADNHSRRAGWRSTHLKTCYAGLMQAVKEEDLKDPATGDFWLTAGDLAFFYPVIEMAGAPHARFIPEVLYIYNLQNPLNDCKVDGPGQQEAARYIDALPAYAKLDRLPWTSP